MKKIDPLTDYILRKDSNVYRQEQGVPSWGQLGAHYTGRTLGSLGTAAQTVGSGISTAAQAVGSGISKVMPSVGSGGGQLASGISKAYGAADPYLKAGAQAVLDPLTHPLTVGIGAAAAIIFGAKKLYQNYMSKAAEQCREAPDKKQCMDKLKVNGKEAVIRNLNSQLYRCQGNMECMRRIRRTIERFGGEAD